MFNFFPDFFFSAALFIGINNPNICQLPKLLRTLINIVMFHHLWWNALHHCEVNRFFNTFSDTLSWGPQDPDMRQWPKLWRTFRSRVMLHCFNIVRECEECGGSSTPIQSCFGLPNKNGAHVNEGYVNHGLENRSCMHECMCYVFQNTRNFGNWELLYNAVKPLLLRCTCKAIDIPRDRSLCSSRSC